MAEEYPVTFEHAAAFGAIIQFFARTERLIETTIAGMLKAKVGPVHIVTSGLGYSGKRDALLSLLVLAKMPGNQAENIKSFVDKLHAHSGLRNAIAHSVWREGKKSGAIKPFSVTARGGTGKIRGLKGDEPEYTVAALNKIVVELDLLHNSYRDYLSQIMMR